VAALARTILRTAWGAPIIAQASTRRIIGGHGRVEAARAIMAGIMVDGVQRGGPDHRFDPEAPGPGMVPVRLVAVTDAEADAMTLADNARALQGVDDAAAMVAMATASFDAGAAIMADIGLGQDELAAMLRDVEKVAPAAEAATTPAITPTPPTAGGGMPNGGFLDALVPTPRERATPTPPHAPDTGAEVTCAEDTEDTEAPSALGPIKSLLLVLGVAEHDVLLTALKAAQRRHGTATRDAAAVVLARFYMENIPQ
jgi:hypothetical protein